MIEWMKVTFGIPQVNTADNLTAGKNGRNLPSKFFNKKGIYGLLPMDSSENTGFDGSGHVDIFYDCTCNGKCHFNPRGGIKNVYLWELN